MNRVQDLGRRVAFFMLRLGTKGGSRTPRAITQEVGLTRASRKACGIERTRDFAKSSWGVGLRRAGKELKFSALFEGLNREDAGQLPGKKTREGGGRRQNERRGSTCIGRAHDKRAGGGRRTWGGFGGRKGVKAEEKGLGFRDPVPRGEVSRTNWRVRVGLTSLLTETVTGAARYLTATGIRGSP